MKFYALKINLEDCGDIGETSLWQFKKGRVVFPYFGRIADQSILRHNLGRRAKIVDFLWPIRLMGVYDRVISHKAYDLMQDFNIAEHHTLPLTAVKNGRSYEYIHFLFQESIYKYIDLDSVELVIVNKKLNDPKIRTRPVDDPATLLDRVLVKGIIPGYKKERHDRGARVATLNLVSGFDLDFFSLGNIYTSSFISERLMHCFIENKVTGLNYEEVDFINVLES